MTMTTTNVIMTMMTLLCTSLVRGLENSLPVLSDLIFDDGDGDGDGV